MMINVNQLLYVNWRNLMLGSVHKIYLWVITLNTFICFIFWSLLDMTRLTPLSANAADGELNTFIFIAIPVLF